MLGGPVLLGHRVSAQGKLLLAMEFSCPHAAFEHPQPPAPSAEPLELSPGPPQIP